VRNSTGQQVEKSVVIRIDRTPPTIASSTSPAPNTNGWNNTAVSITFTAADALSGVDTFTGPVTGGTEGAAPAVSGTATDRAGNSTTIVRLVNIDRTPPEIVFRFDPATRDVVAIGRDATSGLADPVIRPLASANLRWRWADDDENGEAPCVGPGWQ